MIRIDYQLILFLLMLYLTVSTFTRAKAQDRQLTMENAVTLALEKNRDLQVSKMEMAKSAEKIREARGYALPTVGVSAQYLHFFQKQVSFLPGSFVGLGKNQLAAIRVGGKNAFLGGVSLSQPLFQAGVRSGIRAARVYEELSGAELAEVQSNVVTDVKKAYLNVLITQE